MKILKKDIETDKYIERHLEIINPILPVHLTPKEVEVLAAFMSFTGTIITEGRFNSLTRKSVMQKLNLSLGGLSNYLASLTEKGFIDKDEMGNLTIKKFLFPEEKEQEYMFKLKEKHEESSN